MNLPFTRVLLDYPLHAAWITSTSSSLRCTITSGSVNMSSWMQCLDPCVLMTNIVRILSVFHLIGGASGASIFIFYFLAGKLLGTINCVNIVVASL